MIRNRTKFKLIGGGNMPDKMLTTGQFARLCSVTKRTLLYYNDIGLFHPAEVDLGNGRFLYRLDQAFQLNGIRHLQSVGLSLEEILEYMSLDSRSRYLMLKKAVKPFTERIRELKELRDNVTKQVNFWENTKKTDISAVQIIWRDDEQIFRIRGPQLGSKAFFDESLFYKVTMNNNPLTTMISTENVLSGLTPKDTFICFGHVDGVPEAEVYAMPKGQYLVAYHVGAYTTTRRTYQRMWEFCVTHGLRFGEYSYEKNMLTGIVTSHEDEFITRIMIAVETNDGEKSSAGRTQHRETDIKNESEHAEIPTYPPTKHKGKGNMLSASELASMAHVTKKTLFYYNEIGILTPALKDPDNGRFYYEKAQLFDLSAIRDLVKLGMPLEKIQGYFDSCTDEKVRVLKEYLPELQERIDELTFDKRMLQYLLKLPERHMKNDLSKITIIELPEITVYTERIDRLGSERFFSSMLEKRHYIPGGTVMTIDGLMGVETPAFVARFTEISSSRQGNNRMFIREEGKYLVAYHKGSYDKKEETYKRIMDYVQQHGLKLGKYYFERNIIPPILASADDDKLIEIEVQIV